MAAPGWRRRDASSRLCRCHCDVERAGRSSFSVVPTDSVNSTLRSSASPAHVGERSIRRGRTSSARAERPDLATAFQNLPIDLHVVRTFGFTARAQLGQVGVTAIAKADRSRMVRQVELNFELAVVPAGLRLVVVRMDHGASVRSFELKR